MDTLWTYRKKKSFRYIKIDKKKEELQANLQKKKRKITKMYPFLLKPIEFHVKLLHSSQ